MWRDEVGWTYKMDHILASIRSDVGLKRQKMKRNGNSTQTHIYGS